VKNSPKYGMTVSVTPNLKPAFPNTARVEARVKFAEGVAVFSFAFGEVTDSGLATTIGRALEEGTLQDVRYGSDTAGLIHLMWDGVSYPVSFSVSVEGPDHLYSNARNALKERVSKQRPWNARD
jgi:hypothetical protein